KPISTQRAQTFGEMVAEGLQQLKDTDPRFDLDDYVSQEKITTTMLIALPAALRTTKAEKLSALRNAVLNAALPGSPDEDIIVFYLNAVDTLPASALKILEYFADPEDFGKRRGISYQADMTELDFFTRVFEEFNGQPELLDMLMRMLDERRFSGGAGNTASLGWLRMASDNMPSHPPQRRITPLGERFLAFIREPPNLNLPL
ncbi:MAG TPA: hypothetical protein VEX13_14565, partial [Chloroflexia bacterium]|nr:hypothetical protein [Chloroflexia bacterium]